MVRIRSVVNGNEVEESEDQAAFLVGAGLFEYMARPAAPIAEPELAAVAVEAEPVTVRRSRKRKA